MNNYKEEQINIFQTLINNNNLTGSAKNQIRIFIDLLNKNEQIGFDTTSTLFYGFLNNSEFIDPESCPLTQKQISEAKNYFFNQAQIRRAKETSLLKKIAKLPLLDYLGEKIDLKDLALCFLTYAAEEKHYLFDQERVKPLYNYLNIPSKYFLNVYDLFYDFDKLNINYTDFIINLSRLKISLVPPQIKAISILHDTLFNKLFPYLPKSLYGLSGNQLEDFIMECYEKAGFSVIRIGKSTNTPDGGVDIIAYTTRPLEGDLKYAIQCKTSNHKIEAELIRSFDASLKNFKADKGIYISKMGFTNTAVKEVKVCNYKIELMDYIKISNQLRTLIVKV